LSAAVVGSLRLSLRRSSFAERRSGAELLVPGVRF
jgi:hypothetical protein